MSSLMNQARMLPQHVAVIMDGNGRWAKKRGLPRVAGHKIGADRVKELIRHCLHHAIPVLSLFAFSSENWARPEHEVGFLMDLFIRSLNKELAFLKQQGVSVRFVGDLSAFSQKLQAKMCEAQDVTASEQALVLNIIVNYGGKWDIVEATKAIARQVQAETLAVSDIDETCLAAHLSLSKLPMPDLFIRTSGEQRLSNFLLWQLAYAELYFCDETWPDFKRPQFEAALLWFATRERRFGKTSEQLEDKHV